MNVSRKCRRNAINHLINSALTPIIATGMLAIATACSQTQKMTIAISSDSDFNRSGEMVEIPTELIREAFGDNDFKITDSQAREIDYQITYDNKLIFLVNFPDGKNYAEYYATVGTPTVVTPTTVGALYPQRQTDLIWENEHTGFRVYGPGTQEKGEKLYGYDLYLKRVSEKPLVGDMLILGMSPDLWQQVDSLNSIGLHAKADSLTATFSYHADHGHGLDCYAVGPTLGAGTAALIVDGKPAYPWCFKEVEILDNGPLRFTARLMFDPVKVGQDTAVVESRLISLDKGDYFNRTTVSYDGLSSTMQIAAGIALHDDTEPIVEKESSYMAYLDPTQGSGNGELYIGAVFGTMPDSMYVNRNDEASHVFASDSIAPGKNYTYYWGFGWSRADVKSMDEWKLIASRKAKAVSQPLKIEIK